MAYWKDSTALATLSKFLQQRLLDGAMSGDIDNEVAIREKASTCCCCELSDEEELSEDEYIENEARKLLAKETSGDDDTEEEESTKNKKCCSCGKDNLPRPLQRAYTLGVKGFFHGLWSGNPLKSSFKDFIVGLSIVLAFGAFISSTYSLARNPTFLDAFSFTVSFFALIFSTIDFIIHIEVRRCKTCMEWRAFCIRNKPPSNDERKCCGYMTRYWDKQIRIQEMKAKLKLENTQENDYIPFEELEEVERKVKWCQEKCGKKCGKKIPFIMDCLRIFLTEMMYYPLLITSVFSVIINSTTTDRQIPSSRQIASYALVGFSLGNKLLTVYFQRVQLLAISFFSIQKSRFKRQDKSMDKSFIKGAFWHSMFVLYSYAQMVIQIFIILVTARAYYYYIMSKDENTNETSDSIKVELSHIIFLIIIGYFIPLFGTVMFFVTAYSWVREFFIEFFDQLWNSLVQKKKEQEEECGCEQLSKLIGSIDPFRKDYDIGFLARVYYPVFNIPSLLMCGFYAVFIIAYIAIVWRVVAQVEQDSGWIHVVNLAGALILIVNIHPIVAFLFSFLVLLVAIIRFCNYLDGCKDENDMLCIKNYCANVINFSTPFTISY